MKKYSLSHLFYLSTLLLFPFLTKAQSLSVQQTLTPQQLVQQVLAGQGVVISNITYNGSATAAQSLKTNVSYFSANGSNFPISTGVLLSTGNGIVATGPNSGASTTDASGTTTVSDPDLQAIATGAITNGVILEFDFIPSGDSISFRYIFASEEYEEFSPSSFNDAFGFFISGPGISGTFTNSGENIALLPSPPAPPNTYVTINNVNQVTNTAYYVSTDAPGEPYYTAIEYDGCTVILTAKAAVQCQQTYHIKLCISNVVDQAYDSGVFLEANSFKANVVSFSTKLGTATSFTDTLLAEGCKTATLEFIRPHADTAMSYIFQVTGTADPNADIIPIGDTVHFPPGVDTVDVVINPIADGVSESDETFIVTGYSITACGDTIYNSVTLWITDHYNYTYNVTPNPAKIFCLTDSAQVAVTNIQGSIPPFTYLWQTGDTTVSTYLLPHTLPHDSIPYVVEVKDGCGYAIKDTVYLVVDQTLKIDTTYSLPTPCGEAKGAVVGHAIGITGPGNGVLYTWNGPGKNNPSSYNATIWQNIPSGWYYFSVTDQVCTVKDSAFVDISNPPVAQVSGNPLEGPSPLNVSFTNSSQNADSSYWFYGDGSTLFVNNLDNQSHTYTAANTDSGAVYSMYLVVTEGACSDTAKLTITIPPIPPDMVISTANVFTPNGDGSNDTWHFSQFENVKNVDVLITNRWGNVVYQQSGTTISWNGTDKAGAQLAEGTYFYTFDATDLKDKHVKGHGFIQLVRK